METFGLVSVWVFLLGTYSLFTVRVRIGKENWNGRKYLERRRRCGRKKKPKKEKTMTKREKTPDIISLLERWQNLDRTKMRR